MASIWNDPNTPGALPDTGEDTSLDTAAVRRWLTDERDGYTDYTWDELAAKAIEYLQRSLTEIDALRAELLAARSRAQAAEERYERLAQATVANAENVKRDGDSAKDGA